jgi:hypothetical protein
MLCRKIWANQMCRPILSHTWVAAVQRPSHLRRATRGKVLNFASFGNSTILDKDHKHWQLLWTWPLFNHNLSFWSILSLFKQLTLTQLPASHFDVLLLINQSFLCTYSLWFFCCSWDTILILGVVPKN